LVDTPFCIYGTYTDATAGRFNPAFGESSSGPAR
jgi:hypothetical protein